MLAKPNDLLRNLWHGSRAASKKNFVQYGSHRLP